MTRSDFFVDSKCLVVAEIAQAHDGSLGIAHAHIDAAAEAGADAVKFQTHLAEFESTPNEPWRVAFSTQDASRFEYWQRMEFPPAQWEELRSHAKDVGLLFASSPFSVEAVELLDRIDVDFFKIASGEITNLPLVEAIANTGRPVAVSSGMSPIEEIDRVVELLPTHVPVAILQCTSKYPCPPELIGLNVIGELRDRHSLPVGLSDHSGTIYPGLAAAMLSISMLEVHLTLSRRMFGPDVPASVTTEELATLVEGIRFIERMTANPVDKDALVEDLTDLRSLFMKSPVTVRALTAGHILQREDITLRKAGTGLPSSALSDLPGRILIKDVAVNHPIDESDLEVK